jgi:PAS domain S-box-containing protein
MDLNKLLKLSADLICTIDAQNRFVEVSEASYTILGYRPSEMRNRAYKDFIFPEDLLDAEEAVIGMMTNRPDTQIQSRYLHKDGRIIPLLWCAQWDEEDQLMYCIARSGHITEQTELMRESLEESNRRYHYVTQATSDAIWDWNILSGTLYWGEGFETIFGYDIPKLPTGLQSWTQHIHPDDFKYIVQSIDLICASNETNWKEEYRYQKADGTFANVVDRGFVIRDKNGKAVRMVGAMHDISERKKALHEMGRVTADLFTRNRELHEFGYIISHNLRSPVANIKSITTLMEMETDIPDTLKPYLTNLIKSVSRMDEVIIDLSKILSSKNRSVKLKTEAMDLQVIVNHIKADMADKITHSHAQVIINGGPFIICSNQAYIYNILFNLIANSIKYKFENPPVINIHILQTDEEVTINYIDNSYGFYLSRHGEDIFKPYKVFHPTFTGKGLGLFLVKSYIEALDGSVYIGSAADQGVSYRISLPKIK